MQKFEVPVTLLNKLLSISNWWKIKSEVNLIASGHPRKIFLFIAMRQKWTFGSVKCNQYFWGNWISVGLGSVDLFKPCTSHVLRTINTSSADWVSLTKDFAQNHFSMSTKLLDRWCFKPSTSLWFPVPDMLIADYPSCTHTCSGSFLQRDGNISLSIKSSSSETSRCASHRWKFPTWNVEISLHIVKNCENFSLHEKVFPLRNFKSLLAIVVKLG